MKILSNYELPTYFEVNEELFRIRNQGDFRIVLSCFNILSNIELSDKEKVYTCLIVFYEDFDDLDDILECSNAIPELVEKMFWFFDCGQDYKSEKVKPKLVDWDKDEMLIMSAVNKVAGREIRNENIHWWTFISYYMAIGECPLSQIVSIRHKLAVGKKLEKHELEFKNENPQYFDIDYRTQEDKAIDDWIQSMWKSGGDK